MVNQHLDEHKPVILAITKRTYHLITGMFAEKNLRFSKFVKVYIEKNSNPKMIKEKVIEDGWSI